MKKIFRIGLDFSSLDRLNLGNGQYRYVVDLVRGLAELPEAQAKFFLYGSREEPVVELADIFKNKENWTYNQIPTWSFKGSYYLNYLRYPIIINRDRLNIWHTLHGFIPILSPCFCLKTEYDLMSELFDDYKEAVQSRPYRIKKWALQHLINHIITISQNTAKDLEQMWKIPQSKISVVALGANFSTFNKVLSQQEAASFNDKYPKFFLLSPYNLEPRKNLDSLLKAMPALLAKYTDLYLVLFGRAACTPEREENFKKLIRELQIEERVILTGFIPDTDLALLYRYASLFVFPSLYEGFGLPVLEAMSMASCAVVRKASSMAEIVGNSGVLVEPCYPENLTLAISDLLDNEEKRKQLGKAAQERSQRFTVKKMALQTWQVYEKVLKS